MRVCHVSLPLKVPLKLPLPSHTAPSTLPPLKVPLKLPLPSHTAPSTLPPLKVPLRLPLPSHTSLPPLPPPTRPATLHLPSHTAPFTLLPPQDSLGGNSKTVMIANVGPVGWNADETVSTLKYAQRARSIKNAPKVNDDPTDAMVQQYREQVWGRCEEGVGTGMEDE
eukprot:15942-Chlamydomonas_euryale.AAC.1